MEIKLFNLSNMFAYTVIAVLIKSVGSFRVLVLSLILLIYFKVHMQ